MTFNLTQEGLSKVMNDGKLDVRLALRAFNAVRDSGEKRGEGYYLKGITVTSDFDGYNLDLTDGYCNLTVHFHNKFTFTGPNRLSRQEFIERLKRIVTLA